MAMKRLAVASILITLFCLTVFVVKTTSGNKKVLNDQNRSITADGSGRYVTGEIIVKFKDGVTDERIDEINERHKTRTKETVDINGKKIMWLLEITGDRSAKEVVEEYRQLPEVEVAALNSLLKLNNE